MSALPERLQELVEGDSPPRRVTFSCSQPKWRRKAVERTLFRVKSHMAAHPYRLVEEEIWAERSTVSGRLRFIRQEGDNPDV